MDRLAGAASDAATDPDSKRTPKELIEAYGYNYEEHSVTTDDYYVLQMWRVNKGSTSMMKKPVFLQHGLFSDGTTWILNKGDSLAFKLADAGFDVWIGNNRGELYSRKNKYISETDEPEKFYDYSFYELGKYDAPAQVDYVRWKTWWRKITYIGHSQGTSQMFSALSMNHGYLQSKLDLFIACAPIINLKNSPNTMM